MSFSQGFQSKLPDVGTTIFTVMSRRATLQGAVNVGQGFPDYPIDPRLAACVGDAIAAGFNQYAPMEGSVALRAAIASKISAAGGREVDPETELTVTCGGTESIYSAIQAVVGQGHEAIVFDPAYDAYDPAIRLAGGRCIHIPLRAPGFRYDWDRVRDAVTERTRLIVINNPHNPACTVASAADLDELAVVTRDRPIAVIADEVYEHVHYDGRHHQSVMNHPELRQRSFAVYSFGKTLHITGWRVGYCVAPPELTRELRKVHQFNAFSIAAPLQAAIAFYLQRHPDAWREVATFFSAKRDLLLARLADSGLELPPAAGTYFQLADYSRLGGGLADCNDVEFTERLINDAGVAVIPLSPFYRDPPADMRIVRLCVAKRDETLIEAAARISAYTSGKKP
ncbi:MAG TPA: methionine aminotransferase [Steroidobacteraceae bacterium]|jgi:methionine aminotransferase|nr:methionine aminotransferase [Steroidobacteraceae bacterium]